MYQLNSRQTAILEHLRHHNPTQAAEIATAVDAPVASVRRAVARLRQLGHDIRYADIDNTYNLVNVTI